MYRIDLARRERSTPLPERCANVTALGFFPAAWFLTEDLSAELYPLSH